MSQFLPAAAGGGQVGRARSLRLGTIRIGSAVAAFRLQSRACCRGEGEPRERRIWGEMKRHERRIGADRCPGIKESKIGCFREISERQWRSSGVRPTRREVPHSSWNIG